ncbi:hypothetical protein PG987_015926 [Apiospora arundinis]
MLYDALRSQSVDREKIVGLLLDNGADPTLGSVESLLEAPFSNPLRGDVTGVEEHVKGNLRLYHLMIGRGATWSSDGASCGTNLITLLIRAKADDQVIFDALDGGYNLNLQGRHDSVTPLMASIMERRWDLAYNFLRRGANINTTTTGGSHEPYVDNDRGKGLTALHLACTSSAPVSLLERLFELGAKVDAGLELGTTTPLFYAVSTGNSIVVSLLIVHGATINAKVRIPDLNSRLTSSLLESEWSPLDYASFFGELEVVQLLFDLGGRSAIRTFTEVDGAVHLARCNEWLGVLRFFEERIGSLDRIPDIKE